MKKILTALALALVIAVGVYANLRRAPDAVEVRVEEATRRDLRAIVSGSGQIRPFREVNVSSNVMGEIVDLAVEEGQEVGSGDFLLGIDPTRYRSAVEQVEAQIAAAETSLELARENLEHAQAVLDRREGLYRQDLLSKEAYDEAVQAVRREERTVQLRRQELSRLRAQLQQSEYELSLVSFRSPIDGVITSLNVEEGETAITGTMNNPGTVLLTIADLSQVEAEIRVDETDIVHVEVGQEAVVRIDAFPGPEFDAAVTEVGKSPIQGSQAGSSQAVEFKVVVRITEQVPGARPGLSCTADITTATREQVLAVPIQALMLREVELDDSGDVVRRGPGEEAMDPGGADAAELDEMEGAFVVRDDRAVFMPVEVGIAGERHFEVLSGIEPGDRVVIGPFDVIRTLQDGERVEAQDAPSDRTTARGRE